MKNVKLSYALALGLASTLTSCSEEVFVYNAQPSVKIADISSVSSQEVTITFTPGESVSKYLYAIGTAADMNKFLNGELANTEEAVGEQVVTFSGLRSDTEYTIFTVAYGKDGKLGAVASQTFSPNAELPVINVNFSGITTAGLEIQTTAYIYKVVYAIAEAGQDASVFDNTAIKKDTIVDTQYKYIDATGLEEGKDYAIYAKCFNRFNKESDLFVEEFSTSLASEAPSVEFELISSDPFNFEYSLTPNANTSKFLVLGGEKSKYDNILHAEGWGGDIWGMMLSWWDMESSSGESQMATDIEMYYGKESSLVYETYLLKPQEDIEFFVLTYDKAGNPFAVETVRMSTPALEVTGSPSVKVEEVELLHNKCTFKITPNEHTVGVMYSTFLKTSLDGWYDPTDAETVADLKMMMHDQMIGAYQNNTEKPWAYGSEPFDYVESGAKAGTTYYVAALPVGQAGVESLGDVVLFEYTVPDAPAED